MIGNKIQFGTSGRLPWKVKNFTKLRNGLDIHRLFNMACNRELKYRIENDVILKCMKA
jgi:hypothetical protein